MLLNKLEQMLAPPAATCAATALATVSVAQTEYVAPAPVVDTTQLLEPPIPQVQYFHKFVRANRSGYAGSSGAGHTVADR